jgi:three-Cys-motif partner protein
VSDNLPAVWSAESHTLAKHKILSEYLVAWIQILSRQSQKIGATSRPLKYIDAFAGPGIYENGNKGSPILAIEVALKFPNPLPVPVEFVFIENDGERHRTLEQQISLYHESIASSSNVHSVKAIKGDCVVEMNKMLDHAAAFQEVFGPALVFLDQFGYSGVPMSLIARVLSASECEVLTFFFWRELDRFIGDKSKHAGINSAFGGNDWQPAINMGTEERIRFVSET